MVAITAAPEVTRSRFEALRQPPGRALPLEPGEHIIGKSGEILRISSDGSGHAAPAVLIPLDSLFEVRLAAAQRLWRSLCARSPGSNPAALSRQRRDRLALALRALDGEQAGATHRQIAGGLFGPERTVGRGWISDDLRDRTARLVRLGVATMNGGYLRLLLHPYRGVPTRRA